GGVLGRGRGLLDPVTAQDYVFRAAHPLLAGPMPTFSADRLGDCTDCAAGVRACPMQLDIRPGPQADCLACGACLDACAQEQHQGGFGPGL
ncbi:4Fe-4S dicluster domain-containing protein, partial [Klebsiella pneumoniae]|uniref:4Fe-4S dicluster domain-containing protein n=1 Tax=Klebsiella pneumoniae TaxID=573 RepID=UPI0026EB44A9